MQIVRTLMDSLIFSMRRLDRVQCAVPKLHHFIHIRVGLWAQDHVAYMTILFWYATFMKWTWGVAVCTDTRWSTVRTRAFDAKSPPHAAVSTIESRPQKSPICPITTAKAKVGHAILTPAPRPRRPDDDEYNVTIYTRRRDWKKSACLGGGRVVVASRTDRTLIWSYTRCCVIRATAFCLRFDLMYSESASVLRVQRSPFCLGNCFRLNVGLQCIAYNA